MMATDSPCLCCCACRFPPLPAGQTVIQSVIATTGTRCYQPLSCQLLCVPLPTAASSSHVIHGSRCYSLLPTSPLLSLCAATRRCQLVPRVWKVEFGLPCLVPRDKAHNRHHTPAKRQPSLPRVIRWGLAKVPGVIIGCRLSRSPRHTLTVGRRWLRVRLSRSPRLNV